MHRRKYQFYISFNEKINTAASKAVQDCKSILAGLGYQDLSIDDLSRTNKNYLWKLFTCLVKMFFKIKPGSLLVIQYPLLSGNRFFKYFIKLARLKKIKFICLIHDINELRFPGSTGGEAHILNHYDCIIAHNQQMTNWLLKKQVSVPIISLEVFDYLTIKGKVANFDVTSESAIKQVAFAGNLSKSDFIYLLDRVDKWRFNLYGPNYKQDKHPHSANARWNGALTPDNILTDMKGAFGLIWDGQYIDRLDEVNGNYLKYNNPHKLSLYLAAGLPVIAPAQAAISKFIEANDVGILVGDLENLNDIHIDITEYQRLKKNVMNLSEKIKSGGYLVHAIHEAEFFLNEIN
jgi:hypothetical protein